MGENTDQTRKKFCPDCGSWFGTTLYYNHLCEKSSSRGVKVKVLPRVCDKFYCKHCNKTVSKSTFYEHQALYGGNACGYSSESKALELELDSDSETEGVIPTCCWDDEDAQFFSGGDTSGDDDQMEPEELSVAETENIGQPDQQILGDNAEEEAECFEYSDEIEDGEVMCNKENGSESDYTELSRALLLFLLLWKSMFKVADRAIIVLIKFFKMFLTGIGKMLQAEALINFASIIPETLYMIEKKLGLQRDSFIKYGVCPKCKTLYNFDDCIRRRPNGEAVSAKCSHIDFPRHPHQARRQPCGTVLMKTMRSKSGKPFLYPKQVYCFKKLTESLQELIYKPHFLEKCENWVSRSTELPDNVLGDCYEGRVWKEFQYVDGEPFLAVPNNFGLMLNVDWFQPTLHGSYSLGVIYMVVMNLPREERFKPENLIVVGIIPGPKEPKLHINSFLQPLVDDLIDLWDGVLLNTNTYGTKEIFRAALLALSSDIPATRKCGGFVGHTAKKGCSKCFKEFPRASFGDKPDFSGFDRESWKPRRDKEHRAAAEKVRQAKTPTDAKHFSSEKGARYSVLFQLPYYDAIRFALIDPMHNLLLGSAKHILKTWIEMGIISEKDQQKLQKRVDLVKPPSEIGRLPSKISEGFRGFTADQWKNWVVIYSLFALKGVIPNQHYIMWTKFVQACQILCCKVITVEDCREADQKLLSFCKMFETLCGKDKCTPNMHLHGHLQDCILDYGPVFSFWCFSFERYNGMMGDYHTNNVNIGVQIMRKFLRERDLKRTVFPDGMEVFGELLDHDDRQKGTLGETSVRVQLFSNMIQCETGNPLEVDLSSTETQVPLPPIKRNAIDSSDVKLLAKTYEKMYPAARILQISSFCDRFKYLLYKGYRYSSNFSNCQQASTVFIKWFDDTSRPAVLREFLQHDVIVQTENGKSQRVTHILALVEWYARHPQCNRYSKPVEVWANHYESVTPEHAYYVPVGRFQSNCVSVKYRVPLLRHQQEKVNVIIPLPKSTRV